MNVFVLCTGRCGSVTFIEACRHITNYSSAHESRVHCLGDDRVAYPDNHIEADNRLVFFLGRLNERYGDDAFYVHLTRDLEATARSYASRIDGGIMRAYYKGILFDTPDGMEPLDVARDYCINVEKTVQYFLRDKSRVLPFALENAKEDFRTFWNAIGAEGDLEAALAEWDEKHNATVVVPPKPVVAQAPPPPRPLAVRGLGKARRVLVGLPRFIQRA